MFDSNIYAVINVTHNGLNSSTIIHSNFTSQAGRENRPAAQMITII